MPGAFTAREGAPAIPPSAGTIRSPRRAPLCYEDALRHWAQAREGRAGVDTHPGLASPRESTYETPALHDLVPRGPRWCLPAVMRVGPTRSQPVDRSVWPDLEGNMTQPAAGWEVVP